MASVNFGDLKENRVEKLERSIFEEIDNMPKEVNYWPSSKTVHLGRDTNNELHIGISDNFKEAIDTNDELVNYVLAHELGHELHFTHTNIVDDRIDRDRNIVDGKVNFGAQDLHSDLGMEGIMSEMIAELTAENEVDITEPIDRNPFLSDNHISKTVERYEGSGFYAREGENIVQQLRSIDYKSDEFGKEISELPRPGCNLYAFGSNDGWDVRSFIKDRGFIGNDNHSTDDIYHNMQGLGYHLDFLKNFNTAVTEDDIDVKEVLKLGWAKSAKDYTRKGDSNPIFDTVDNVIDFDYEKEKLYHDKLFEGYEEVDKAISENTDQIIESAFESSLDSLEGRVENIAAEYGGQTPSFAHMVSEMEAPEIYDAGKSYDHGVGCTLGRILSKRDQSTGEILENMDEYRNLVREAVEEASRIKMQYDGVEGLEPQKEDFIDAVEYMLDEKEL